MYVVPAAPGQLLPAVASPPGHWSMPIFLRFDLISSRSIKMRDSNFRAGAS